MPPDADLNNRIAAALTGLVKQIKAVRYYPTKHPALQTTAEESLRTFRPLLEGVRAFSLTIRKEGFLFDDQPVGKTNQALTQLATFCFARRIKYLTILSDLSATDLHRFTHFLNLTPQEIQQHGGIQTVLEKGHVTTIWANEQDLDAILERKEELEAEPEPEVDLATVLAEGEQTEQPQQQEEAMDLQKLLKLLQQERDDNKFQQYLQELVPLLRLNLKEESRPQVLQSFFLLCQCATSKKLSETRRKHSMQTLGQLATDDVTTYLIAYLLDEKTNDKARKALMQVLGFLREKVTSQLMEALAVESAAANRKMLSDVLVRTGTAALPVLQETLLDDRWYVVRNAVVIIGEIRNQETLPQLIPLLQHEDIRVRRETIRALTKVGDERAIDILLQTVDSKDQDLRRQALISLGAIRATTAIPTLLKLARQSQWNQKAMELRKDAIRSLGEIRSSDAVKDLCTILHKRHLWRRSLNDELRVTAATALGEIGDEEARPTLEKATNDRTAAVARAAAQAIKQLDKASQ